LPADLQDKVAVLAVQEDKVLLVYKSYN